MAIAFFPSLSDAELVDVDFATIQGSYRILRQFVDTGFTGSSWFTLSRSELDLALSLAPAIHAFGAIQELQQRIKVHCHIPAISFQARAVAMLADLVSLGLPLGVDGVASLQFLRQFRRWGSEKRDDGSWRFFLET